MEKFGRFSFVLATRADFFRAGSFSPDKMQIVRANDSAF